MSRKFQDRHFPVRPNLEQLRHQAKDLLRAIWENEPAAVAEFQKHHPKAATLPELKLADAQLALARSYGLPSWARLVTACRMTDAIWRGDVEAVRELVLDNTKLLHEAARGLPDSNWGPTNVLCGECWAGCDYSDAAGLGRHRRAARLRSRLACKERLRPPAGSTTWGHGLRRDRFWERARL